MSEVELRTDRMRLRRVRRDDVDHLMRLNRDPGVMRFLDRRPPTRPEVQAAVEDILEGYQRFPHHGTLVAEDHGGEFLGWFALTVSQAGTSAPELGYRLRRAAWGRGLATEGGRALVDHGFTSLGADMITAQTMAVNQASRRVLEKCGLRYVRTFHVAFDDPLPGTEHGEVWYEITRDDWLATRGRGAVGAREDVEVHDHPTRSGRG